MASITRLNNHTLSTAHNRWSDDTRRIWSLTTDRYSLRDRKGLRIDRLDCIVKAEDFNKSQLSTGWFVYFVTEFDPEPSTQPQLRMKLQEELMELRQAGDLDNELLVLSNRAVRMIEKKQKKLYWHGAVIQNVMVV
ncbi:hypothetical protein V5T82_00725 [Magnetovibrio sp. PR-2]|uniref:hypothetical protein n=1 Tax=Magnetovibrio sp. PR-2 TaxID=3120356 RepID=UPI002FCE6777